MRGDQSPSTPVFVYFTPDDRVPTDHPLRRIKSNADKALARLSPLFDSMYSRTGRPSIPPETLLKAQLLIALYSVRSDRLFCEQLNYNILFRWFLDMDLEVASFNASTFSKNRERLIQNDIAQKFFAEVVALVRREKLLSDEHFTVDGTLIESWASLKSFKRKGEDDTRPNDGDPGNPSIDFHGEKRSNKTHESSTDPEARLMRKSNNTAAKLSFCANALMENRNGFCVDLSVEPATGTAERDAALKLLKKERRRSKGRLKTVGADKGYHAKNFVEDVRALDIAPHVARIKNRWTPGLDGRTSRHKSYAQSQRKRKRVEEIFGWWKSVGGLRKARVVGLAKVRELTYLTAAALNLLRLGRLMPA